MNRTYSTAKLDLTGQRFGKLTVLFPAPNIGRDTAWLCRCECGKETVIRTCYLRKGKSLSCGCDVRENRLEGSNRLDLTVQRFGKLTAVEPLDRRAGKNNKWRCVCDCGGECAVTVANLRNGHTRSCGCESRMTLKSLHYVDGTNVELIRKNPIRSNNTSGCTGVVWRKNIRRWDASIGFKGKRYFLGLFERYEDAVQARKDAEEKYFGSFLATYDANMEQQDVSDSPTDQTQGESDGMPPDKT